MQPISRAAANSGWQMEPAGESNDTAQLVPGARSDAHEAQGKEDSDDQIMKRFRERFDPKKKPHVGARVCPSDFGDAPHMNEKVPVLPDTSYPGRSTGNFASVQFGTGEESPPVLDDAEVAMKDPRGFQNSTSISRAVTDTEHPNEILLFAENEFGDHGGDRIQDSDRLAPGQRADDPVLIEDSTSIIEDCSQNAGWKAGYVAAHEDKTNESMPTILSEALHVDRDMDNLELERDTPFAKDPREPPLQEPETPPHSSTSPHHTTVPPCAGPAKEQEENLEPAEEHNADTIVVDCAISDRGESLDDSEDEDYVEESLVVTKRRRVRFADTVRYAPDEPHQLPMSPADTLDNESQGSSSDVACIHEEMPVSGVLTLKEVDGTTQYSLIFSQDLLPHVLRQNSTGMRCSASPSVQGRGRVGRGKHMFSTKDDDKIIQMKEEGKSWDEIAEVISGSTKGSIQVRYSTKLKHRMGTRKRVSKRRRVE